MPPTCQTLTQEYDTLLTKAEEFTALLTKNAPLDQLLTLKQELEKGKLALENKLFVTVEQAETILGKDNVISEVEQVFGIKKEMKIPFKRKELEHARDRALSRGTVAELILQSSEMKDPDTGETIPINLKNIKRIFPKAHDGKPFLWNQDWYEKEEGDTFYETETPKDGWKLTERDVLPDSTSKNYAEQTEILANLVRTEMFPENKIPENYQAALKEWEEQKTEITTLLATKKEVDWKKASNLLASLKLTDITREQSIDILYRLIFADQAKQRKELENRWAWSKTRTRDLSFVDAGYFVSGGADVSWYDPGPSHGSMGVCLSRMKK